MNMTLFGHKVFADGRVKMRLSEWALMQDDQWLYKKEKFDTGTDIYRGIYRDNLKRDRKKIGRQDKPRND